MAHLDDDDFEKRPASRRRRYDGGDDDGEDRRRRFDDEEDYDFRRRVPPHSGLGMVSLAIAIGTGLAMLILFGIAGVMAEEAGGDLDENSPTVMAMGALGLGVLAITLLGVGLGVGAVLQRDRNKLLGTLGLLGNALVLLGSLGLICIGALMD